MDMHELVEAIFKGRGYEILISSPANRYLLLRKGDGTTAVGYGPSSSPATDGEVDMFVSMAHNDSTGSMVFLAPVAPGREARLMLQKEKVSVWDRLAVLMALGEASLRGTAEVHETVPEGRSIGIPCANGMGAVKDRPAGGSTHTSLEVGPDARGGSVTRIDLKAVLEGATDTSNADARLPNGASVKERTGESNGSIGELIGLLGGEEGIFPEGPVDFRAPMDPAIKDGASRQGEHPWKGCKLAPVRFSWEEACSRAGANIDTTLKQVRLPYMLLDVRYRLRAGQTETIERTGSYLLGILERELFDIPLNISSEICSLKETWDGRDPPEGFSSDDSLKRTVDERGALMDRLRKERQTQDRLVRESLMSTIYQEATYTFDPTSFEVLRTDRLMVPFWKRTDRSDRTEWLFDAFLGRYIPKGKQA